MSHELSEWGPTRTEFREWTTEVVFAFVVLAIVFSVEHPLGWVDSPYASVNSEDVAVLALGALFLVRSTVRGDWDLRVRFPRTTALLLIVGGWIVLSLLVTAARSDVSILVNALWTLKWFEVVVFFLLAQSLLDRRAAQRTTAVLLAAGSLLATYAVVAVLTGLRSYRIRVFFDNPNTLGSVFVLVVLLAMARAASTGGRRRYLHAGAAVIAIAGVMMTGSRSALLALLTGVVVIAVLLRRHVPLRAAAYSLVAIGACLLGVLLLVGDSRVDRLLGWIEISRQGIGLAEGRAANGFRSRIRLIREAFALFSSRPIFGYGWFSSPTRITPLDVYYTKILVEIGLPGFLLTMGYHLSLLRDWFEVRMGDGFFLGSAGLAWYVALMVQSVGGGFPQTPHVMLLMVLVLVLVARGYAPAPTSD